MRRRHNPNRVALFAGIIAIVIGVVVFGWWR